MFYRVLFTWRLFDSVQGDGIWFAEEVSGIWEKLKGILGLGFSTSFYSSVAPWDTFDYLRICL